MIIQKEIIIKQKKRGFSLITEEVLNNLPEVKEISAGLLHLFIKHTSASLSLNENADPDVRVDMETFFNRVVPENSNYFIHTCEGSDDMPAHVKSALLGSSITIPITQGKLNLGTWQGIYLGEHRNYGGNRKLVATIYY
ncbi:MAG TPA: secondary thiamine-phosphate synthase enzyme YjbQ [Melioribacteraceae bacterium]|nr:secondary thiamine-phosphate synthase enzyme YjbQ [Melioribacteraceae bacterium]